MRVINALVRKCELFKKKKKKKAIERHKITLVKVTIIIKKRTYNEESYRKYEFKYNKTKENK